MDKCMYCHKVVEKAYILPAEGKKEQLICCSQECAQKADRFLNYFNRTKLYFYIGIFLSTGLILVGAILAAVMRSQSLMTVLMAGGLALLGIVMVCFPFATSESYLLWGIKKSTKIVRFLGGVIILMGLMNI